MRNRGIILFDGVCNLCNSSVNYVIKHDKQGSFRFASLQGETGQQLLKEYGLANNDLNSFILIIDKKVYNRSGAALRVAKELDGIIKILYGFIIVPAFIRNAVYDTIAKNRYKWFGRKDHCMVPTAEIKSRFLN